MQAIGPCVMFESSGSTVWSLVDGDCVCGIEKEW